MIKINNGINDILEFSKYRAMYTQKCRIVMKCGISYCDDSPQNGKYKPICRRAGDIFSGDYLLM